ncbi:signal peptidase I [Candidatus Woesebacteria bacterium]|nr:signal peptidase I [Candidatus Woesebacteria bacterium]
MRFVKSIINFVMEILETVVFVGSIFIVMYLFVLQPNQVKGASMEPSFQTGNYIFTSKMTYKMRQPERGDVIVFKSPQNPDIEFIKRIVGLPGDTVLVENQEVYVNGNKLAEPYISAKTTIFSGGFLKEGEEIIVPDGYYFVMGDNRPHSSDSREFGPIPKESIIGQVFFRYFPVHEAGKIQNPVPESLRTLINDYSPIYISLEQ